MTKRTEIDARRRSRVLRDHALLDTAAEAEFDQIVHQAAAAIGTQMALVSLLDGDRQWFKAKVGVDLAETSITASFCAHAIRGAGVFAVADAAQDPRFARNPLVTGRPHIRFYAGAALRLDGIRVGTLCVLDDQPRQSLTSLQIDYLGYLAGRTVDALAARRLR